MTLTQLPDSIILNREISAKALALRCDPRLRRLQNKTREKEKFRLPL